MYISIFFSLSSLITFKVTLLYCLPFLISGKFIVLPPANEKHLSITDYFSAQAHNGSLNYNSTHLFIFIILANFTC